jgi:YidC/Oxa1 family membrane protein insertase
MDFQRPIMIIAIAAVSLTLLVKWNAFQQTHKPVEAQVTLATPTNDSPVSPEVITTPSADAPQVHTAENSNSVKEKSTAQIIDVYTDTLQVRIDTAGGDIILAALRDYPAVIGKPDEPFVMLNRTAEHTYIAQSGLVGENGIDKGAERPLFTAEKSRYDMDANSDHLTVDLTIQNEQGVNIIKRYVFNRGEHIVRVEYVIQNTTTQIWRGFFYGQIKRDTKQPVTQTSGMGLKPFLGAATTTSEKNYYKMTFKNMAEKPLKDSIKGGWIAMVQHYFISAWIPDSNTVNQFYTTHQVASDTYLMGFTAPQTEVAPGATGTVSARFYVGPKDVYRLEKLAPYLDLTVDYGWLWWIAKPLFWLMHTIHSLVGNWGWAIIGLTVVVKGLFLWPSTLSYRSMAVMKKLAPKMQELKESYGDNPTKLREEMFKMYQKEKANPMLGCLPMIIQTPVFIALYWTLMESVGLRQAPFVGWIVDLSVQDPYFVMPLLMGISMFVQQKLNPPQADPMQQRIFQMMPIVFTGMFLFFPSGLVLYMLVNNLISMTHQFFVYQSLEKAK